MSTLMAVGGFMMAGPVVMIVILKLLFDPREKSQFFEDNAMKLLIIISAIGLVLFLYGSEHRRPQTWTEKMLAPSNR